MISFGIAILPTSCSSAANSRLRRSARRCASADYPTARTLIREVVGNQGVHLYVSYAGTKTASQPKNTGQVHGSGGSWTLSKPANVAPGNIPGWQPVRFTLGADGQASDYQIYNFYVDPRMR